MKKLKKKNVKKLKLPRFGPAKTRGRMNPGTRSTKAHGSRRRVYLSEVTVTTTSTTTTTT